MYYLLLRLIQTGVSIMFRTPVKPPVPYCRDVRRVHVKPPVPYCRDARNVHVKPPVPYCRDKRRVHGGLNWRHPLKRLQA